MMDWPVVKLGDECQFENGKAHEQSIDEKGSFIVVNSKFISREGAVVKHTNDLKHPLNTNDIAMVMSDVPKGKALAKCFIVPENNKYSLNQRICSIKSSKFLTRFLYYQLNRHPYLLAFDNKGSQANLRKEQILSCPLFLPSMDEQQRIVAILDQAFADIEKARANAEQNLKNARELFDSYLQQVFSQRGEGWIENSLENVVEENCSLSYGVVQPGDDFINGLPVVRPTDLKSKIIYVEGLKLIDPLLAEGYKRTALEGGELLLCVRGSTGVISIADTELAGANVTRGIVPIRFDQSVMLQAFGYYQFISQDIQRQIKSHTYGAALMQINIRDLRKLTVVLPPLQFQSEAINQLDDATQKMRRLEFVYQAKLKSLDELKKSLLQKAFSGELTKGKGRAA